ncbi:tetratricopeptide repeat protein [Streptomyces sp. NPDC003697]
MPDDVRNAKQALAKAAVTFGPDHRQTTRALDRLARLLAAAGRHDEAIESWQQLINVFERTAGPDDPDTLTARNNLARALTTTGRHLEAVAHWEQVTAGFERTAGPDNPNTLTARNNLARALTTTGRHLEALHLCERLLADSERLHGPDDRRTLTARNKLADSYSDAGRTQEALDLRERALADSERLHGPDDRRTLTARNKLADSYSDAGRTQEALDLRERALADSERLHGPDDRRTLTARNKLARALNVIGRHDEALDILLRIVVVQGRSVEPVLTDALGQALGYVAQIRDRLKHQPALDSPATCYRLLEAMSAHVAAGRTIEAMIVLEGLRQMAGGANSSYTEALSELTLRETAVTGAPEPCAALESPDMSFRDEDLSASEAARDVPSLDDLFASHATQVARIIGNASYELEDTDLGTSGQFRSLNLGEARRLTREAREAVNSDLIALFLKLGPPPEAAGRDHYQPVNSGGGGTRE